jgi:hypothetical protein
MGRRARRRTERGRQGIGICSPWPRRSSGTRLPSEPPPFVSPLLWGANPVLNNGTGTGDWLLASTALRTALRDAHTQIIRMPVRRPNADTATPTPTVYLDSATW